MTLHHRRWAFRRCYSLGSLDLVLFLSSLCMWTFTSQISSTFSCLPSERPPLERLAVVIRHDSKKRKLKRAARAIWHLDKPFSTTIRTKELSAFDIAFQKI
jgi:hypothetical protein